VRRGRQAQADRTFRPALTDATQPEKDRMDIYHKLFAVARRDQLHQAPVPVQPHLQPRILDVGCGTGIWAIDMAE
jgi:2-polyprenyl-3-methyl-5-hydroxy-6-metoxy-1,4-benzoquinol methylase